MADSILIVDDDVALLQTLGRFFEHAGWDVYRELTGETALRTFARSLPDVVLLDLHLPGIDGIEVLQQLRGHDAVVLLITGDDHIPTAVKAMREGAENFLVKPVDLSHLQLIAERAAEKSRLRRVNRTLVGRSASGDALTEFGDSPPARAMRQLATTVAHSDQSAILVRGETGSGKRTIARAIHDLSMRSGDPFIELLSSSADVTELEVVLCGTDGEGEEGDGSSRSGLFDSADRGTLLVDQITNLPISVQHHIEHALEGGAFRRAGGVRDVPIDFRLIATTSTDLTEAHEAGLLLPELYYRLRSIEVVVPPLRDLGREDILKAVKRVLKRLGAGSGMAPAQLSDAALERLVDHKWPGNFRELRHVLDRAVLLARGEDEIGMQHLPAEFRAVSGPFDRRHTPLTMDEVERMHIERTLKHHEGNRTRSADELGISRATLIAKIKKYSIPL